MNIWGGAFQREGTLSAKALGLERIWCFLRNRRQMPGVGRVRWRVLEGQEGLGGGGN